jgi:hypothetical protein
VNQRGSELNGQWRDKHFDVVELVGWLDQLKYMRGGV